MHYPIQFIEPLLLADGTLVQLRPIHPLDAEQALPFRKKLSEDTIRDRFLGYVPRHTQALVDRLTKIDYENEMAIIAEITHNDRHEVIAVARIVREAETDVAEFAIIIADEWQGKGLGGGMTDFMIAIARQMNFSKLYALLYSHNRQMQEIFKKKGFKIRHQEGNTSSAELVLELPDSIT